MSQVQTAERRHAALASVLAELHALETSLVPSSPLPVGGAAVVKAARRLNRAAGMLALSVLLDSALEHYRGSFENKAMFTPLVVSALTLAVSTHGTADKRREAP